MVPHTRSVPRENPTGIGQGSNGSKTKLDDVAWQPDSYHAHPRAGADDGTRMLMFEYSGYSRHRGTTERTSLRQLSALVCRFDLSGRCATLGAGLTFSVHWWPSQKRHCDASLGSTYH